MIYAVLPLSYSYVMLAAHPSGWGLNAKHQQQQQNTGNWQNPQLFPDGTPPSVAPFGTADRGGGRGGGVGGGAGGRGAYRAPGQFDGGTLAHFDGGRDFRGGRGGGRGGVGLGAVRGIGSDRGGRGYGGRGRGGYARLPADHSQEKQVSESIIARQYTDSTMWRKLWNERAKLLENLPSRLEKKGIFFSRTYILYFVLIVVRLLRGQLSQLI